MKKTFFILFLFLAHLVSSGIGQENKKARELGEAELGKYLAKCENRFFIKLQYARDISEIRNEGTISFRNLQLSESDKLNGVELRGVLAFSYSGPSREFNLYNNGWQEWREIAIGQQIGIESKNNIWRTYIISSNLEQLTCGDLPTEELLNRKIKEAIEFFKKKPTYSLEAGLREPAAKSKLNELYMLAQWLKNTKASEATINATAIYDDSRKHIVQRYTEIENILATYIRDKTAVSESDLDKALERASEVPPKWITITKDYNPQNDLERIIKDFAEVDGYLPILIKNYCNNALVLRLFRGSRLSYPTENDLKAIFNDLEKWSLVTMKYRKQDGSEVERVILYVFTGDSWRVADAGSF